jgi:hypothetical protein
MRSSAVLRFRAWFGRLVAATADSLVVDTAWANALVARGNDDAIASDWAAVGGDMRWAIDQFAASHLRG